MAQCATIGKWNVSTSLPNRIGFSVAEHLFPLHASREALGREALELTDDQLATVRQSALSLAEVIVQAYEDFKAEVEDFDPADIRSSGNDGMLKLIGIELIEEDFEDLEPEIEGDDE